MEKTSLYAYISFTGKDDVDDFPVEEVTKILGVQPTTIKRIGERINDVHTRSFTSWQYESQTLETLDVGVSPTFRAKHTLSKIRQI